MIAIIKICSVDVSWFDPSFDNTWRHRHNRYPPAIEEVFVHVPQQEQPQAAVPTTIAHNTPHCPVMLTGDGLDRDQMMAAVRDDAFRRQRLGDPHWNGMLPDALRAADKDEGEWEAMMEEAMAETSQVAEGEEEGELDLAEETMADASQAIEEEEWSASHQSQFFFDLSAAAYSMAHECSDRSAKAQSANRPAAKTAAPDGPVWGSAKSPHHVEDQ
ncbi:hypothetical protein CYMTET_26059 [Cymbomonas tetramitiformis]|uniref:Uncharacterized protein n=1 Tax=Cymbomonas tetramitiformis TaxID=36881 RepID=A0AAE0FSK9_9CHLO|nr:hypothetical protein CYMTET_26059 [Cymbomonas tetramitiformis]